MSIDGGAEPIWGRNGELFYRQPDALAMMRVEVQTEPELKVGIPEMLFEGRDYIGYPGGGSPSPRYDVRADGERFLMLRATDAETSTPAQPRIKVVLNWFSELRERVPVALPGS